MSPTTTGEANVAVVVREIAADHRKHRGALLPILHAVQEALGCVPAEAIPVLADELNLSRADVHGVVTFYHDFRSEPAGRTTVRLCRAEACQSRRRRTTRRRTCVTATACRWGRPAGTVR